MCLSSFLSQAPGCELPRWVCSQEGCAPLLSCRWAWAAEPPQGWWGAPRRHWQTAGAALRAEWGCPKFLCCSLSSGAAAFGEEK